VSAPGRGEREPVSAPGRGEREPVTAAGRNERERAGGGGRAERERVGDTGRGASGAKRVGSASNRVISVWRGLPSERRLAAIAAIGLFLTLFLPWYQETVIANGVKHLQSVSESLTGWGAFSFVEAAVLLVAAGVLTLLFVRAEGNAFHVPGGDGGVITAAGLWTCVLIVWRIFDKEGTTGHGQYATTSGIEWGIFVALGVAALLAYAGTRIRLAHEPEPPLPGDRDPEPVAAATARTGGRWRKGTGQSRERSRGAARRVRSGPDMGADDAWTEPSAPAERPASDADTRVPGSPDLPPPATAAPRRVRPRSVGSPEQGAPPAPGNPRPRSGDSPPDEASVDALPDRAGDPAVGGAGNPAVGGAGDPSVRGAGDPAVRGAGDPAVRGVGDPSVGGAGDPSAGGTDPAAAGERPRRRRGLDPREIQELDIAEPPAPRLSRSRPVAPRSDDTDDQPTIRVNRPI
jgi:hypothetical protein